MRLFSFLAPLILLAGQTALISVALTGHEILDLLTMATSDTNNAVHDASAITPVNAALDYNVRSSISDTLRLRVNSTTLQTIVTDSDNIANELNTDNDDVQGSADLSEPSETTIAE